MKLQTNPNNELVWVGNVYYQFKYPEGYAEVISGHGYWSPSPIERLEPVGLCYVDMGGYWIKYDPKHPKCGFCGKFVRAGDWWKAMGWTGPCPQCDEDTRWM